MNKIPKNSSIIIKTEESLLNNNNEKYARNRRKLLNKISTTSKSYSHIKTEKIYEQLHENEKNNKSEEKEKNQINKIKPKKFNLLKYINEAKEMNDLEIIFQKWNQERILKFKNKYNNINTYNNETIENNYVKPNNIKKIGINTIKTSNEKDNTINLIKTYDNEINDFDKKKKSVEKIKRIKKKKIKLLSQEDIKNINKRMEEELKIIYKKAYLFLDKDNKDFISKLEYIIRVGKYIQKEIKYNRNNLILPGEAVYYNDNNIIRFLGYFGSDLSIKNIKIFIEKNPTNELLRDITFKIIGSGLATQKIYSLTLTNLDYIKEFENDFEKWDLYLDNIKRRISRIYSVPESDIYFFNFKFPKFQVNIFIYNRNINNLELFLSNLDIKVVTSRLLNNIILSPNMFESKFCKNEDDWPRKNLIRGGRKYYPPYGWIGIALKIKDKYNKVNDIWLGKENKEGEWCVAYHGVGKGNVFNKVLNIINTNLKEGPGQLFKELINVEQSRDKYYTCEEGVYLSPNIEEAIKYADRTCLGWYNIKFKFIIMVRVNPTKIRSPGGYPVDWIVNGNDEEVRPYRLFNIINHKMLEKIELSQLEGKKFNIKNCVDSGLLEETDDTEIYSNLYPIKFTKDIEVCEYPFKIEPEVHEENILLKILRKGSPELFNTYGYYYRSGDSFFGLKKIEENKEFKVDIATKNGKFEYTIYINKFASHSIIKTGQTKNFSEIEERVIYLVLREILSANPNVHFDRDNLYLENSKKKVFNPRNKNEYYVHDGYKISIHQADCGICLAIGVKKKLIFYKLKNIFK